MNPTTTLTNHNPPATHQCGLNPSPNCREESDTPQKPQPLTMIAAASIAASILGVTRRRRLFTHSTLDNGSIDAADIAANDAPHADQLPRGAHIKGGHVKPSASAPLRVPDVPLGDGS